MSLIPCANTKKQGSEEADVRCGKNGVKPCNNDCGLVAYCSEQCQSQHRLIHAQACESELSKEEWQPRWAQEERNPAFKRDAPADGPPNCIPVGVGTQRFPFKGLWGSMPAIDVLKLRGNKGESYGRDLSLCFAASGDIHNALKTVGSLPESYTGTLNVTINDQDIDMVFRNFSIIALLASDAPTEAQEKSRLIDTAINLWYSSRLKRTHIRDLKAHIRPIIERAVRKIKGNDESRHLKRSIPVSRSDGRNNAVKVVLTNGQWAELLNRLDYLPPAEMARQTYETVMLTRVDHWEKRLFDFRRGLHGRVSRNRFRREGVLAPFGGESEGYTIPNPFLFSQQGLWLQGDAVDPHNGWNKSEIDSSCQNHPVLSQLPSDVYGRLYHHIHSLLTTFHSSLRQRSLNITLTCATLALGPTNEFKINTIGSNFDRIDVSNLSETNNKNLGIYSILSIVRPLLNPSNKDSTILSLFARPIRSRAKQKHEKDRAVREAGLLASWEFFGRPDQLHSSTDPRFIRFSQAKMLFLPFERWFSEHAHEQGFEKTARENRVKIKAANTIVPEFPYRLRKGVYEDGAQQEFDARWESGLTGAERYVEWQMA